MTYGFPLLPTYREGFGPGGSEPLYNESRYQPQKGKQRKNNNDNRNCVLFKNRKHTAAAQLLAEKIKQTNAALDLIEIEAVKRPGFFALDVLR